MSCSEGNCNNHEMLLTSSHSDSARIAGCFHQFYGANYTGGRKQRVTFLSGININISLGLLAWPLSLCLKHILQGLRRGSAFHIWPSIAFRDVIYFVSHEPESCWPWLHFCSPFVGWPMALSPSDFQTLLKTRFNEWKKGNWKCFCRLKANW